MWHVHNSGIMQAFYFSLFGSKVKYVAKKTEVERAWDEITSGKLSKAHQNNTP